LIIIASTRTCLRHVQRIYTYLNCRTRVMWVSDTATRLVSKVSVLHSFEVGTNPTSIKNFRRQSFFICTKCIFAIRVFRLIRVCAQCCRFPQGVPWVRYHGKYKDLNINLIWPGKDPSSGKNTFSFQIISYHTTSEFQQTSSRYSARVNNVQYISRFRLFGRK
jgi:hypothetical protein